MNGNTPLVNAWIFLNDDWPSGTSYVSPNSCYQRLFKGNIYQSIDILNICFVTTLKTSAKTVPQGDGSSYTLSTGNPPPGHPGGLSNEDYMVFVIRDARRSNPNIKITVTLVWGFPDVISNIFSNPKYPPPENAARFAANLMAYLKKYGLDGFDIDWEGPLAGGTTQAQFGLLINAIGAEFKKQTNQHYFLTISPATIQNIDPLAINNSVDFINFNCMQTQRSQHSMPSRK